MLKSLKKSSSGLRMARKKYNSNSGTMRLKIVPSIDNIFADIFYRMKFTEVTTIMRIFRVRIMKIGVLKRQCSFILSDTLVFTLFARFLFRLLVDHPIAYVTPVT